MEDYQTVFIVVLLEGGMDSINDISIIHLFICASKTAQ